MGWFNKKKDNLALVRKAGTEAGQLTMTELNLPFLLSRFHESDGVKFPQGFFKALFVFQWYFFLGHYSSLKDGVWFEGGVWLLSVTLYGLC